MDRKSSKGIWASLAAGLGLAIMALGTPVGAASVTGELGVSVTVEARALLDVEYQANSIAITRADIARGYAEVPAGSRIEVRTNSPHGYLLAVQMLGGPFREVFIDGLGAEAQVTGSGGWISQSYSAPVTQAELSYRFVLSPGATPGVYAWPLALSASPR
jgi:hypothetical protein